MNENRIKWFAAVERNHTPLFVDIYLRGLLEEDHAHRTGLGISFRNMKKEFLSMYVDADELKKNIAFVRESNQDITPKLHDLASRCLRSCEKLLAVARKIAGAEDPNASADVLREHFRAFFDQCVRHSAFVMPMLVAQKLLEDQLALLFAPLSQTGLSSEELERLKTDVQFTTRDIGETANIRELLQIGIAIQRQKPIAKLFTTAEPEQIAATLPSEAPEIWTQIQQFKSRFAWIVQTYFLGRPMCELEILGRLKHALTKSCNAELKRIEKNRDRQVRQRAEALDRVTVSSDRKVAEDIFELVDLYVYLRSYRMDVFAIAFNQSSWTIREIAAKNSFEEEDMVFLTGEEILSLFSQQTSRTELSQLAKQRKEGFGAEMIDGNIRWYIPSSAANKIVPSSQPLQLQGTIANPGSATGTVRIVLSSADITRVQQGDILVTTMTLPNIVAAVEKAAAIVTDEGGILCHAAIVSRELNIPCVIGTKTATKRLTDGERVKVDADTGTIIRLRTV